MRACLGGSWSWMSKIKAGRGVYKREEKRKASSLLGACICTYKDERERNDGEERKRERR